MTIDNKQIHVVIIIKTIHGLGLDNIIYIDNCV